MEHQNHQITPNLDGPGEEMEHSTSSGYTYHPGLATVKGDEDFTGFNCSVE